MVKAAVNEPWTEPDWPTVTDRLRRIALALTGSHDDADDLTQQTLVTLLVKNPDRADHAGYARKTMLRLWLDRQRSLRRQAMRLARLALAKTSRPADRDRPSLRDQYEETRRAIEILPPRQRAVVVLRLVEELDYAEIAATLNCSVRTVRANLHLGRQRVRQLVGEPP